MLGRSAGDSPTRSRSDFDHLPAGAQGDMLAIVE